MWSVIHFAKHINILYYFKILMFMKATCTLILMLKGGLQEPNKIPKLSGNLLRFQLLPLKPIQPIDIKDNYCVLGYYPLSSFHFNTSFQKLDSVSICRLKSTQLGRINRATPYLQTSN
jgi:hypothetical protein